MPLITVEIEKALKEFSLKAFVVSIFVRG